MFLLPSFPRYERISNADGHRRYWITDDVYISPIRRVKCRVRVLASRITPPGCSGAEHCGLDVFIAHGWAVTPWYWPERWGGRFSSAFISDERFDKSKDTHMREAYLPAMLDRGAAVYADCTHLHIVTAHAPGWRRDMPEPGELFDLDMVFVEIHGVSPSCDTSELLARGSAEFGTMECPFVIPTEHLSQLKSFSVRPK